MPLDTKPEPEQARGFDKFTAPHKQIFVERLRDIIGESLGEASMCWRKPPEGEFDSSRSRDIMFRTVADVLSLIRDEGT